MSELLKIVAFGIFCAITYGVLHDMVTAHMSVEYFTIAHPAVFPTESPLWLAIGWGIIATWWVGLILGTVLGLSAQVGNWPKIDFRALRRPMIVLMGISGVLAMLAGAAGWALTEAEVPGTIGYWSQVIDAERHSRFAFAVWAHSVSYLVGAIGGLVIAVRTIIRRRSIAHAASTSSTYSG